MCIVVSCLVSIVVSCLVCIVVSCLVCIVVSCLVCIVVSCLVCIVVSCLVCIVVSCLVCIVVVVLCVLLSSYVHFLYCVCIAVSTLDAGLPASSQNLEGPATGHLNTGFLGFPVSISKRSDGSQHSKLPLHASHVALQT